MAKARQGGATPALTLDLGVSLSSQRHGNDTGRVDDTYRPATRKLRRSSRYDPAADVIIYRGRCQDLMKQIPNESVQLAVTSPPYNIGKSYEVRSTLEEYIEQQRGVITDLTRTVADGGSICWQVGNHVYKGEVFPLDAELYPVFKSLGLHMRNRIVWHYEHGLHANRRFSGRYEVICWYTKGEGRHYFDVDELRIPQKYPNKRYFRGPRIGELSGNPNGKNPGDVWIIPNVKWNHVEKTVHPCQFPIELVERLVLSMTRPGDMVFDPYGGVGSSVVAAVLNGRRGVMAETLDEYIDIAGQRLDAAERGQLRTRPRTRPVYKPS